MSHPSDVYWNTHKRCFSIRPTKPSELEGFKSSPKGRVFYNTGPFLLLDPVFRVNERGRQWVLRNKKKTVHATIRGLPRVPGVFTIPPGARLVKYNPYQNEQFVLLDGTPIFKARTAYLKDKEVWII
ncbi:hypothetical protein [Mesorhizobium sp. WSM2239]|uniref:Uncharacterized protein n=2 Tax=unclassified Mesorhizobium TaxID=325217 RepID=A0AAU8DE42_9HYPH